MFRLLISKILLIMMTCAVIAVSISACSAHKAVGFFHDIFSSINETDIVEGAKDFWSELVESLGNYSITDDDKLIGTRTVDADGYFSGEYYAQCYRQTAKESVFGGTSVHSRDVTVKADIKTVSGDVTVRVRKNGDIFEFKTDSNGKLTQSFNFESGGNYVMLVYDDFSGTVNLSVTEK